MSPAPRRRAAAVLLATAALAAPGLAAITTATAGTAAAATPATVSGVRVAGVTASSVTLTLSSLGSGWRYRLYASTRKSDVYYAALGSAPYRSGFATTPRVTLTGLPFAAAPYWYRIQATKGTSHRTGPISSVGLLPAVPTSVRVSAAAGGSLSVTWAGSSGGYDVQQATDSAFGTGVRTTTTRGTGRQLSPSGLVPGRAYYFRVRARNSGTVSAFSPSVRATATALAQPVRVMTYNILAREADGTAVSGSTVAPWAQRRTAAAQLITSADPGVIAVQEGASWVVDRLTRQVDDLAAALGGRYAVAATESLPPERGWFRTGCYVLYRTDLYEPVGGGGHFDLGTLPGGGERWAAYQALRSKSTGATFLVVSPHLYVNGGSTADDVRRAETATMVTLANKLAATLGRIPVVYAGDFNSHEGHAVDGPAIAARAAGLADSLLVAPSLADAQYNSANQYLRTPPAAGLSIDHIYASPGVAVTAWRQVLRLRNGTFDGVLASDHNPVIADVAVPYAARL